MRIKYIKKNFCGMLALLFISVLGSNSRLLAQQMENNILRLDGIRIEKGESVRIEGPTTATAFRFNDGRIVVGSGKNSKWSFDNGHTWVEGIAGPSARNTVDLGNGEIISIRPNSIRRPNGKFALKLERSTDNWKTIKNEEAVLDIPNASITITGDGDIKDGFIFHHGILKLDDGTLVGTMYGNYEGDNIYCDGYPPALNQRKYRTIVVFSKDKGHTWGNHVLVAYDKMLGRGIQEDQPLGKYASATAIVPAVTQEGFREADIVQAGNGDLLCVMRSGGRNGKTVKLFPTPLYCARSTDQGKSWLPPEQIADRGVCPNLVKLTNGIIVCTYSRPGNWLIFSDDNGKTWKGAFQFGNSGDYNFIVEIEPNEIQVYHEVKEGGQKLVYGTFFHVEKK